MKLISTNHGSIQLLSTGIVCWLKYMNGYNGIHPHTKNKYNYTNNNIITVNLLKLIRDFCIVNPASLPSAIITDKRSPPINITSSQVTRHIPSLIMCDVFNK